jgi:hypothetical protein
MVFLNLGEIPEQGREVLAGLPAMVVSNRHGIEPVLQNGARERVNFAHASALPTQRLPRDRRSLNSATYTKKSHCLSLKLDTIAGEV